MPSPGRPSPPPVALWGLVLGIGCATGSPAVTAGPGTDPGMSPDDRDPTGWPEPSATRAEGPIDDGMSEVILRFGALVNRGSWTPVEAFTAPGVRERLLRWPGRDPDRRCDSGCGVAWRLPGMPAEAAFFLALEDWLRHGGAPGVRVQAQDRRYRDGTGGAASQASRALFQAEVVPGVFCEGQGREFRDEDRPAFNPADAAAVRLGVHRGEAALRAAGDSGGGEFLLEMGPAREGASGQPGGTFRLHLVRTWEEDAGTVEGRTLGVSLRCMGTQPLFASVFRSFRAFQAEVWGATALCLCPLSP